MTGSVGDRGHWSLDADLEISVDGVPARVSGSGRSLDVFVPDPARFGRRAWRGLPAGVGSPRSLASAMAQRVADEGVAITVRGPRFRLMTVGAGTNSALGAAVLGSRRVSFPALTGGLRAVAGLSVGGLLLLLWSNRRRDRGAVVTGS